jgi:hypothetical protein
MFGKIFENHPLKDLADSVDKAAPIQVEHVTIGNPKNIDQWIVKAISAPEGLKEKIFARAIQFAASLPEDYREDFLRAIREEYGDIPKSLKRNEGIDHSPDVVATTEPKSESLETEEIKEIRIGAAKRKRLLDIIDEDMAWKNGEATGGFMEEMVTHAKENLPDELLKYKQEFNEEYPGEEELLFALDKMPKAIGERFDAHGIAKGNNFESLVHLLSNGVDLEKTFFTMPLYSDVGMVALGAVSPYTDGGIIVVGPVNAAGYENRKLIVDRATGNTNIAYVVLDREYYFAIPRLQKAYPQVKFIRCSELIPFMTEEVRKKDVAGTS